MMKAKTKRTENVLSTPTVSAATWCFERHRGLRR